MATRVEIETEVQGWASCVTPGCPSFDADIPVELVRETLVQRADDLPIDLTSTRYLRPVEDSDYVCPECQQPRSITDQERREIPNHLANLIGEAGIPQSAEAMAPGEVEDPAQTMARAMLMLEQMRAEAGG